MTARDAPHPLLSLSVAVRSSDATAVCSKQQRDAVMKEKDWDQLDAMSEAGQAMLAAIAGVTAAAHLRMGRELILRVKAVDLSALVRMTVVVGATILWLASWASGSVPVLMDQRASPHAVTPSGRPAWCDRPGGVAGPRDAGTAKVSSKASLSDVPMPSICAASDTVRQNGASARSGSTRARLQARKPRSFSPALAPDPLKAVARPNTREVVLKSP